MIRPEKFIELYSKWGWPLHRNLVGGLAKRCKRCITSEECSVLVDGVCEECWEFADRPVAPLVNKPSGDIKLNSIFESAGGVIAYLLSGGKDSSYVAHQLRARFPDLKITCILVDNGFLPRHPVLNAERVSRAIQADLLIVRSRIPKFKAVLRQAFLDMKGRSAYGVVDFADGSLIHAIGEEVARSLGIRVLTGGLSSVQIKRILGKDSCLISDGDLKVIHPLALWKPSEEAIHHYVKFHRLVEGSSSPLATNNELIPVMCAIDVMQQGYCSFEPEISQMIREGKANRKEWLYIFELLEYLVKKGRMNKSVKQMLARLDLKLEDILG